MTWTLKTFQGSRGLQDKVQASGSRKGPRQLAGGLCSRGQVPCPLWVLKQEDIPEPQESQAWTGAGPLPAGEAVQPLLTLRTFPSQPSKFAAP